MTLRDKLTADKRLAHHILDEVRRGMDVPLYRINWALVHTGDLT